MRAGGGICRATDGNVAITFGFIFVTICMAAGAAVDIGRAHGARTRLAATTDAAALAAAKAPTGEQLAAAAAVFAGNYSAAATLATHVSGQSVSVAASIRMPTSLLSIVGIDALDVSVSSEATAGAASSAPSSSPSFCILLLEPSQIGLYANSDSQLDADCGIRVNSSNSEALFVNSNSHVRGATIKVHGNARLNGGTATPAPIEGAATLSDPLTSLPEPANASAACNHTDYTVNNGETKTMWPGVYCKKTLINSGGTADMQPGVYIFREGEFLINSQSSVTGGGVMMYFKDKDARLNVNSDSTLEVSAPSSGTYAGMLMFQGRDPDNSGAPSFIINSDGSTKLEGVIYLPLGTLELNSISTANANAAYTTIISRDMVLNSYGTMRIRSDYAGATPLPPLLATTSSAPVHVRLTK